MIILIYNFINLIKDLEVIIVKNLGKDYSDSNTRFLVWTIYLSNTLDGGTEFYIKIILKNVKWEKLLYFLLIGHLHTEVKYQPLNVN